jgi:hypothetical protein
MTPETAVKDDRGLPGASAAWAYRGKPASTEGLAVGVGNVAEAGQGVTKLDGGLLAQVRGPFGLDLGLGLAGDLDRREYTERTVGSLLAELVAVSSG